MLMDLVDPACSACFVTLGWACHSVYSIGSSQIASLIGSVFQVVCPFCVRYLFWLLDGGQNIVHLMPLLDKHGYHSFCQGCSITIVFCM